MFHLLSSITIVNTLFEVEVEIENQTLNCKISGEHQIQTLRCVGHLRPGWTFEPRPKWPMGGLIGHLGPPQVAVGHLRPAANEDFYNVITIKYTIVLFY